MADPKDFSNKQFIKQNQLGLPFGNKIVLGELTTYTDGSAKWTYAKDTNPLIAGPGDRSTFTLYKDNTGKWQWTATTDTSVENLASRENITTKQINDSLYTDKAPANAVLNGGNVINLGGTHNAKKFGVPGTTGKATSTGPIPSTVSGNFTGQPSATSQATPTNPTDVEKFDISKSLSENPNTRKNFPKNLRYPEDMSSGQDKLKIDMIKFAPRPFGSPDKFGKLTSLTFGDRNIESPIGTVYLAIPGGVSDNNKVNWGSQDMNAADAAVANAALQIIQKGGDAIGEMGKQLKDVMTDAKLSKDITTGFAALFAGQAAGVQGLLQRTQGAVLNPNTELLFQGPALRAFTFTFKLSPRSEKEAKIIRSIIRFFKQGMAVQRTEKDLFLKAPHLFKLSFLKNDTELNPFLPKTKLCALLDCSVDYTPEAQYATFIDSSMVSYEMSLTFNELDPIFNDEYGNAQGTEEDTNIGY